MEKLCNKDPENGGRPFDRLPVQVAPVIFHCVPHLWLLLVKQWSMTTQPTVTSGKGFATTWSAFLRPSARKGTCASASHSKGNEVDELDDTIKQCNVEINLR